MPVPKNLRGVLFRNNKANNDRRPDYVGVANVNGERFQLAAWIRTDRRNNNYLSIQFTESTDDEMLTREDS